MSDKAEDNRHLDIVLVSQTIANHYEEFRIGQDITFMHEALRQMYDRAFATGYTAAQADTEAKVRAAVEAAIEEAAILLDNRDRLSDLENGNYHDEREMSIQNAKRIRALNASAIVARVMRKEGESK